MISPTYDVLSYGTLGIDRILHIPHWPAPDTSTHTLSEAVTLGGKATNTAATLAAWGAKVAVSGTTLGMDDTAARFLEMLKQHRGISAVFLEQRSDIASMYCCILVTPNGERAIIGVNTDSVIPTAPTKAMIQDARVLTLDLYGGDERFEAARLAHEVGRPVIVGDVRDANHPVLAYTTIAIASAAELRVSHPNWTADNFAHHARKAGAQNVIVTDGSGDIRVFAESDEQITLKPPQVSVIDATGAGDAFRAGVTFGVLRDWELAEGAALGAAAGSLTVQQVGAASNPPDFDTAWHLAQDILRNSRRIRREV